MRASFSLFEIVFTLGKSSRTFLAGDFIDNYPNTVTFQAATVEMHEVRWYLHEQTVNRALLHRVTLFFFVLPRLVTHDYITIAMNQRAAALNCIVIYKCYWSQRKRDPSLFKN